MSKQGKKSRASQRPIGGWVDVEGFVADLAARPEAEQREMVEALIAQFPPGVAEGCHERARGVLSAARERGNSAVAYRTITGAPPEKTAPLLIGTALHPSRNAASESHGHPTNRLRSGQ